MSHELYLCCDRCGHMWNVPNVEIPACCENCSAEAVVVCTDGDDQEERSIEVLDAS